MLRFVGMLRDQVQKGEGASCAVKAAEQKAARPRVHLVHSRKSQQQKPSVHVSLYESKQALMFIAG